MTTVCWDQKILAADTLYVTGTRKLQGHYEKILLPEGANWTVEGQPVLAIGFSGAIATIPKIKAALEAGATAGMDPGCNGDSFQIMIITDKKVMYYWNHGTAGDGTLINELFPMEGNHAIGSGGIYGLGVMAIKGNAIDGTRAAIKVDVHSGGYIDVWSVDEPLKLFRIDPNPLSEEQAKLEQEQGGAILCAPGG